MPLEGRAHEVTSHYVDAKCGGGSGLCSDVTGGTRAASWQSACTYSAIDDKFACSLTVQNLRWPYEYL